jgi:hypothetical protein
MRVLAPRGRIIAPVGARIPQPASRIGNDFVVFTKPIPDDIDDWTHYLYDASNNAVSKDSLVSPPGGLQWVASPRYSRSHEQLASISAAVIAGGRIFSIEDRDPIESVAFPPRWILVARDAFNGFTLWRHEMGTWEWHLHLFLVGPAHLPRQLVAVEDRVYVTLSVGGPAEMLDAATGETLKTFDGTEGADEIVHTGELMLVYVGHTGRDVGNSRRKRRRQ